MNTYYIDQLLRVTFKIIYHTHGWEQLMYYFWCESIQKLAPVASLVSVHHLRDSAGLVGPVSV